MDSNKENKNSESSKENSELIISLKNFESTVDESILIDVFLAYGLSLSNISKKTSVLYLEQLHLNKKTFPYLLEVIQSDRFPQKIMKLAHKIGMYIPTYHRLGLKTYQFYLQNIRYYERVFYRHNQYVPTLMEIYLSKDPVSLCMKFRDDEILQSKYIFNKNYDDRKIMIQNFISNNVEIYGRFKLRSNSRKGYSGKSKSIIYIQPEQKLVYEPNDLLKLVDLQRNIIWKDSSLTSEFSRLSLHSLRQQILERFEQWKHRDGHLQFSAPAELGKILNFLDLILVNDPCSHISAYLGNPQISVTF